MNLDAALDLLKHRGLLDRTTAIELNGEHVRIEMKPRAPEAPKEDELTPEQATVLEEYLQFAGSKYD